MAYGDAFFPVELAERYSNINFIVLNDRIQRGISNSNVSSLLEELFEDASLPVPVLNHVALRFHKSNVLAERWGLANLDGKLLDEVSAESSFAPQSIQNFLSNPHRTWDNLIVAVDNMVSMKSIKDLLLLLPENEKTEAFVDHLLTKLLEKDGKEIMPGTTNRYDVYSTIAQLARIRYDYPDDTPDEWILEIILKEPPKDYSPPPSR